MKQFVLIICVIFCVVIVYDGGKSKSKSLKESIEEFKVNNKAIQTISIIPDRYIEVKTDTLTKSGFEIKILNYSLMGKDLLIADKKNNGNSVERYHRKFESKIEVSYKTKDVIKLVINADRFKFRNTHKFWNNATLQHSWVDLESSDHEHIVVKVSFVDPSNSNFKLYNLKISNIGDTRIELVEEKIS